MSQPAATTTAAAWRLGIVYVAMLAAAVAVFLLIRWQGEAAALPGVEVAPADAGPAPSHGVLLHVLLALAAIIILGRALGIVCGWLGQPPVIGEMLAGILLGPSLLGRIAPEAMQWLLPTATAPYLGILAQFGVILFMFLVGLELNAELLRRRARETLAIAHASIVVPFLLGAGLALWLQPSYAPAGFSFTSFALFLGIALSITAFPVLARILADRGLAQTDLGVMALGCAAANDLTAWCLLALVVGVAQTELAGAVTTTLWALGYLALMFAVARPIATRWLAGNGRAVSSAHIALALVALLLSAAATEAIGVHALFGAFLLGAIIPHDSAVARALTAKMHDVVTIVFLPAFFAYTGLRTEIGLVDSPAAWLVCLTIIGAATLGKFGGTFVAARLTGIEPRTAAALGVLMNTRGLMELIVLNIGLELGVLSPTLFAMMVLMALATTIATGPLLGALYRPRTESPVS